MWLFSDGVPVVVAVGVVGVPLVAVGVTVAGQGVTNTKLVGVEQGGNVLVTDGDGVPVTVGVTGVLVAVGIVPVAVGVTGVLVAVGVTGVLVAVAVAVLVAVAVGVTGVLVAVAVGVGSTVHSATNVISA